MDSGSGEFSAVAKTVTSIRWLSYGSLTAIVVLRDHLNRIRYQPRTAPDLLKDLRSLEQTIEDAVNLLNKHDDISSEDPRLEMFLGRLETDLQDCLLQVNDWVADEALQPSCGNHWNDLFKRVRFYDEAAAEKCARFEQRLQQLEKEAVFVPNEVSDIQSSTESMASSSSHYAGKEIEKSGSSYSSKPSIRRYRPVQNSRQQKPLRDPAHNPTPPQICHWSCGALNGIDDVFEYQGVAGYSVCKLCSFKFYWTDDECFIRQGQHLVKRHAFGSCEGVASFEGKADFMTHLAVCHKMMLYDFNQGSPKEWPDKPWIDELFRRWGSAPEPSNIPIARLDGTSQLSYPVSSLNLLYEISEILQSSGLMRRLDYRMPKGELTGHPWNQSACVTEICNALAKLDRDETVQILGRREYSRVCYIIGCLQEELAISGYEELLTLETYKSSAHDILCHSISTGSSYAVTHRVNSCWQLPLQDKKPPVHCATLLDVLRLQNRAYNRDDALKRAGPHAIARMLECLQTDISRSPAARPMGRLHARAIDTPFRLERDPTLGEKEARRAQTLVRKVDEWMMGTFVHSISLRRVLLSGKVIPELTSTTPTSWSLNIMEHWAPESPRVQSDYKQEEEEEDYGGPGADTYSESAYSADARSSTSGTIHVKRPTLFQGSPGMLHKSAAHVVREVHPEARPLSSHCSTHISHDTTAFGEDIPQTGVATLPPD
ncbi:hypothetical protein PG994_007435 [Apiospora phragmitis]|uniref:Uncharacterized protein n=1 Tax=Apiospora phragmitis TaxID=2905665 RepID=A0ABR1V0V8_9PEZI